MTTLIEYDGFVVNVADISTVNYTSATGRKLSMTLLSQPTLIVTLHGDRAAGVCKQLQDYSRICKAWMLVKK